MAVLALAAAGAVAGSFAAGALGVAAATGAAWGWMLGSVAGQALFAPRRNAEGPRLREVHYTQSAYGAPMARVMGTAAVPAIVIWAGPLIEVANRQKVGKRSYSTTYSGKQSFAILIHDGEIAGVRRIWFNGELVYTTTNEALSEVMASGRLDELMTIHLGTETQQPDAVIEAIEGAGNVPAYRGCAYIVFDELDLAPWGNSIPNIIKVEVVEAGAFTAPTLVSEIPIGVTGETARLFGADLITGQWIGGGRFQATYQMRDPATGAVRAVEVYVSEPLSPLVGGDVSPCLNDPRIAYADMGDPDPEVIDPGPPPVYEETNRGVWLLRTIDFDPDTGAQMPSISTANQFTIGTVLQAIDYCLRMGDYIYAIGATTVGGIGSGNPPVLRAFALNAEEGWVANAPAFTFAFTSVDTIGGGGAPWLATDGTHLYVRWTGLSTKGWYIFKLTWDLQLVEEIGSGLGGYATPFAVWDGMLLDADFLLLPNYTIAQRRLNGDGTATLMGTVSPRPLGGSFFPTFLSLGNGLVLANDGEWSMVPTLTPSGRSLAQAITRLAGMAGVQAGELEVSDVSSITVAGYTLDRPMPARSAIEPLRAAYGTDCVESGTKLKFVRLGAAAAATIAFDDLGVSAGDAPAGAVRWENTRAEQTTLPQAVTITYADADAAYETGTQGAGRGLVLSQHQPAIQLPLVLSAAQAAQAANRLLYEGWAGRTGRQVRTTLAHAALEPTDVVWLEEAPGQLARVRVVGKTIDDGVIAWEVVDDDDGTAVQIAAGGPLPPPQGMRPPTGSTAAVLFETPPLRDEHASLLAAYAVLAPYNLPWPGAAIWVNTPGDTDYYQVAQTAIAGVLGQAMTALATRDVSRGQADPGTLDVRLTGGEPQNVTESQWLGGRNLALVGAELIRYRSREAISGGWRLQGLLRHQHGTDYAANAHAVGEPVVLLDDLDTAQLLVRPAAEIGATKHWRTPTVGQPVLEAATLPLLLRARTLRPLPPVHLTIVRQANGDRTVRWHRRARAWQDWREDADIPMLEAAESYRVEIRRADTGALLRSATVSTPAVTYTAAQITADLGALPPTHIRVRVMQQSALVGDGEPADVTLPWAGDYNAHYARDWDDLSAAGMTAFGASPELSTSTIGVPQGWPADSKTAFLRQNHASTNDVKARFDRLGNFADGLLRVKTNKIYDIFGTNKRAGLVARTTHWRNAIGGFGYAVEFLHDTPGASIRLVRGTNSDSGTITQIGSIVSLGTTATSPSEIAWLLAGSSHKVWVDGVLRIDTTDSTHPGAGGCGLYLHGQFQNAANFDDFTADYRST